MSEKFEFYPKSEQGILQEPCSSKSPEGPIVFLHFLERQWVLLSCEVGEFYFESSVLIVLGSSFYRHGLAATSGTRTRTGPPRAKKYEILFSILIAKKRIKKLLRGVRVRSLGPYQRQRAP